MPSTLTRTNIVNLALVKLGPGGGFITDYAGDQSVQGTTARLVYEPMRDLVIEAHPWRFARARAQLAADSAAPTWGFEKQYTLPPDFLRLLSIEGAELEYEVEGGFLLCNEAGPLNIRYLKRVTDEALFTPSYVTALATRIAAELAPTITQSSSKRTDLLTEFEKVDLPRGQRTDRYGAAASKAKDGSWNDSRV